jgi:hypothetical protein
VKPNSRRFVLDDADRSPHLIVAMSTAPPNDRAKAREAEREAKLAQALRANLRRRKADAAPKAFPPKPPPPDAE